MMTSVRRTKAGALTERVARLLLGAPSGVDPEKGQVRFGDISINIVTGRYFDFSDETAGGHIELIEHVKQLQNGQALEWFDENVTKAKPLPLPQESAAERALIGLLAMKPELMAAVEEEITSDHFAEIIHKQLFTAISREHVAGEVVSMKAMMDAAGGDPLMPVFESYTLAIYIAKILAEAPTPPDATYFVRSLAAQLRSEANRQGDVDDEYDPEAPSPPAPAATGAEAPFTFDLAPYAFPDPASIPRREWLFGRHYIRGAVSATIGAPGRLKLDFVQF
jgi:hypothetical protein